MAENGVKLPVSAKNNEIMYGGWCLGISPCFCGGESKWGLRLVREPLLTIVFLLLARHSPSELGSALASSVGCAGGLGREWKALLRTCSANVPGTVREGLNRTCIGPVVIGLIGIVVIAISG